MRRPARPVSRRPDRGRRSRPRAVSSAASDGASAGRAVSFGHRRCARPGGCEAASPSAVAGAPTAVGNASTRVGIRLRALPSTASRERSKRSGSAAAAATTATRSRSVEPAVRGQRTDGPARRGQGLGRRGEADAGPEVAGPQPLGDLLVGVVRGQLGRVDTPEVVPVGLDQRDAGTEHQVTAGRGGFPPSRTPCQCLDLRGVERAAATAGGAPAAQLTPADVRVHRLGLHAQALGRLARREPLRARVGAVVGCCLIRSCVLTVSILIQSTLTGLKSSIDSRINIDGLHRKSRRKKCRP